MRAADRGVIVRVYLGAGQLEANYPPKDFKDLAVTPTVTIRNKPPRSHLMHLKCYQIDDRILRTGSANFTPRGLKKQNNDLVIALDTRAVAKFKREFETHFANGQDLQIFHSTEE
ncbi:MAG TPA: phospholipase D-like domain-containing protein [Methylocella sp.]|nr:phospholipase D-like domain-containing protein [Methylocella sp.]